MKEAAQRFEGQFVGRCLPSRGKVDDCWLAAGCSLVSVEHYDDLDPAAQERVRDGWRREFEHTIAGLDFAKEFEEAGSPYSELDAAGRVVTRIP